MVVVIAAAGGVECNSSSNSSCSLGGVVVVAVVVLWLAMTATRALVVLALHLVVGSGVRAWAFVGDRRCSLRMNPNLRTPNSAQICVGILGPWTFYNPALQLHDWHLHLFLLWGCFEVPQSLEGSWHSIDKSLVPGGDLGKI